MHMRKLIDVHRIRRIVTNMKRHLRRIPPECILIEYDNRGNKRGRHKRGRDNREDGCRVSFLGLQRSTNRDRVSKEKSRAAEPKHQQIYGLRKEPLHDQSNYYLRMDRSTNMTFSDLVEEVRQRPVGEKVELEHLLK